MSFVLSEVVTRIPSTPASTLTSNGAARDRHRAAGFLRFPFGKRAQTGPMHEGAVGPAAERVALHAEMSQARSDLARLLAAASDADLRRRSAGTRWTNEQLL